MKIKISYEVFGKKVEVARNQLNLTQADFAKCMGVRQQTISRWEAGISRPRLADLAKIMAFFQIKEREKIEWLISGGYQIHAQQKEKSTAIATMSFSTPIPFDNLSFENFERCTHQLLTYLYPEEKVHQFGGAGQKQEGLDIEVRFDNGTYYDFQCKRQQQFGPQQVKNAVQKYSRSANNCYIVLSRIASPKARKEIAKYPNWDIWDASDLSLKIRELSNEKSCKIIDRFFSGSRFALLGIQEIGAWKTAQDFFIFYNDQSKFSNHKWTTVGQIEILHEITRRLEDKQTSILFISGTGGSGKSKLLYDLSNSYTTKHPHILFRITRFTEKLTEKGIDDLGNGEKILVVDDAHEQENLNLLFQIAATPNSKTKLLILTRLYGFDKLRSAASNFGLSNENIFTISIPPLTQQQSSELSKEVLTQFNGPIHAADYIANLTHGCPFTTVLGSYTVAQEQIDPLTLINQENFRNEILYRFENIITGSFDLKIDANMLRSLLGIIALIQPFSLDDQDFRRIIENTLDQSFDRVAKLINILIKNNIIIKRGEFYKIFSSPLSDLIIENSCIINEVSTGLAERIFEKTSGAQIENILHNIGKFTWLLSRANKSDGFILDIMWRKLEDFDKTNFATPEEIIKAITSVACYQPKKALDFSDNLINRNKYLHLVPQILKYIAYNLDFIIPVCVRLWKLGKIDLRPINQYPSHPINTLAELCRFEQSKSIEYCKAVVKFWLSIIHEETAWQDRFTPLNIIYPILATEIDVVTVSGLNVSTSRPQVIHASVADLRMAIINELLKLLENIDLRRSLQAANFLYRALQYSMSTPRDAQSSLTSEFVSTLNKIKEIIKNNKVNDLVLIEILYPINWHVNYGPEETQLIANEIISLLPKEINFRLLRALIDGWGRLWKKNPEYSVQQEDWQSEMSSICEEVLKKYSEEELLEMLRHNLMIISSVKDLITSCPHIFINTLSKESLGFSRKLINSILRNPKEELASYAGSILSSISSKDRAAGLSIAKEFIKRNEAHLLHAAIQSIVLCERRNGEFSNDEIDLIRSLCNHEDFQIINTIIYAIEKIGYANQEMAIDILLDMDFRGNSEIADAALRLFYPNKTIQSSYNINETTYKKIFENMLSIPKLDGHWLEHFISKSSYDQPKETMFFFINRINIAIEKNSPTYRPFNYAAYIHTPLRFQETSISIQIMQLMRNWIQTSTKNSLLMDYGTKLFFTMFDPSNESVIEFLKYWLRSELQNDINIVIEIISTEPNDIVINNPTFIIFILNMAEKFGQGFLDGCLNNLFISSVTGSRSGIFGQPYPKDVYLKNESTKILNELSPISPAYSLYERILNCCNESILRSKKDYDNLNTMDVVH